MSAAPRILILNERDPLHPRTGGAETHVWEVFGRLARRGCEVTALVSSFRGGAPCEEVDGIAVRRLAPLPLNYLRAAWTCARETRRGRVDLVVECLNKLPFYAPLYARAPVLALCHHLFGETAFLQVPWPVAATVWLAERPIPRLYRRAFFVTISESSRADLVGRGVPPTATRVIPCGIRRPQIESVVPIACRRQQVVYVGRLEPYKRVDVLLHAVARLRDRFPQIETVVVGRGKAETQLARLADELGIADRTRFAGFVPDAERDRLLAESRVCVCPSLKEGWGLTVIEANAVGTPVVATDAPGLRDSVRDGATGFLAPEGDIGAFAAHIAQLLSDDALAERMAREARAWSDRFDWDTAADEMEALVRQIVEVRADGKTFVTTRRKVP